MSKSPPRISRRLIELLLPRRFREAQLGDLEEGYRKRSADPAAARRWYRRQVLRSIPGALRLRLQVRNRASNDGAHTMQSILQDLRFAARSVRKRPGFAVVAVVTLGLAIGVNTSIFSLVSAIVFADLPMKETDRVAVVRGVNPEIGIDQGSVSPADFLDLRERARSFASLDALTEGRWVLTGQDRPERVSGLRMTPGTLDTWRLPPVLGRSFSDAEGVEGGERVVLLTHGFWQDRFDADPGILGRTLTLDGREHTVIGVTHPDLGFGAFGSAQVIAPLRLSPADADRSERILFVSGRLAPGVDQAMATREARSIGESLAREHPEENAGWGLWSAPVMESLMDDTGRSILLLLQLAVAMVILIACANVANMLLARGTTRAREMAVRTAIGAGRGRLIRQLLTESLLVSLAAGGLGLGVAYGLNRGLVEVSAGASEAFLMAELDRGVFLFTAAISVLAPMVFGLFPAWKASGASPSATLRDGRGGSGGRHGGRARGALVSAQIALALTLMIVATLLTRTVINLHTQPLGYEAENLITARVDLPERTYPSAEAWHRFFTEASEEVRELAGFQGAEATSRIPGVESGATRSMEIEGRPLPEGRSAPAVHVLAVTEGFMETVELPVLEGRGFTPSDDAGSVPVAVISREVAQRFFPGGQALGERIRTGAGGEWIEVVGIVGDVRSVGPNERPAANVYRPFAQDPRPGMYLTARTRLTAATAGAALRDAVWAVDDEMPIGPVRTVGRAAYEARADNYALITLFSTFAIFALVMAAVGIYGVMAYSVNRRKTEIGVRMALGAPVRSVRTMILAQGGRLAAVGLVAGLLLAFFVSRLLSSVVFGISTSDPLTFIGMPLLLAAVALVANIIPARRATRTDPARTLRAE